MKSTEQPQSMPGVARILVVDDDPQFRRTLQLALATHGYQVTHAADGKKSLECVAAGAPDLIVLDWHLPEMDGIETCRALRAYSDVPVIMVSANHSHSKSTALAAGANDYLTKPFSVDELLARIESALKH